MIEKNPKSKVQETPTKKKPSINKNHIKNYLNSPSKEQILINSTREIFDKQIRMMEKYVNYYDHQKKEFKNTFLCPVCQKEIENYGNNSAMNRHITNCLK